MSLRSVLMLLGLVPLKSLNLSVPGNVGFNSSQS